MENVLSLSTRDIYTAGFFDGKGSIVIVARQTKDGRQYQVVASLVSRSSEVLETLRSAYGGRIYRDAPDGNRARVYRLSYRSKDATTFLKMLLPFLTVKRRAAEIAIEFQGRIENGKKSHLSTGEIAAREKLADELKAVNHRGGPK